MGYEAQSQIYKEAMYVFKGARQLCRAALVSAEPKQSLENRKKAKELFQETFEGRTLAHSSGDVHVCDLSTERKLRSCSRKPLRAERLRIAVAMCTFAI